MKKLTALLTAVTMLLCTTPLSSAAEGKTVLDAVPLDHQMAKNIDEVRPFYYMGDNGYFDYIDSRYGCSFLVTTDGTVPDEEDLQKIPGFISCKTVIVGDWNTGWSLEALAYEDDFYYAMPAGTVVYRINVSDYDTLLQTAQQYAIEHDWVEDVYLWHYLYFSTICKEGSSTLRLTLRDSAEMPADGIEGLSNITMSSYSDRTYFAELDDANKSRLSGNDELTDEDFAVMVDVANHVMNDYHECIASARFHGSTNADECMISNLYPVWKDHGDANGDQTINASDAAEVLIAAAMAGAGRSVDTDTSWDVNLDGTVNAADAACILIYAAQYGANGSADWAEILK